MLTNPTIEKLKKMKLNRMAEEYANPPEGAAAMNFDDRFGLMVEKEWLAKHNRRINNLMKNARFRISNACLEDIRWEGRNPECRQVLNALGDTNYIEKRLNVLITGKTGCGKTFISNALGVAACRRLKKVRYVRVPELLLDLAEARTECNSRYKKVMNQLNKTDLLIIDDLGLRKYSLEESYDIYELVQARYDNGSMIIDSQLPTECWYELFPNPTVADGIMDRVMNSSYKLELETKQSMRRLAGDMPSDNPTD